MGGCWLQTTLTEVSIIDEHPKPVSWLRPAIIV